jgi:16S rRNA (uracil1498-N3)-methyltransferase
MQRFSFPNISLGKDIIVTELSFIHQVSRVLRSSIWQDIVLFNGDGQEYVYSISSITKKDIWLSYQKKYENTWESLISVRLYQAMPNKYEKIEYILQKGTEIWIREFIFFRSDRSQYLAINERKKERFHEIVREATEQSMGNQIPNIIFYEWWIPIPEDGQWYILHTEEYNSKHIGEVNTEDFPVNIFVGPEGGWSPSEINTFNDRDGQKIHLGKRILRTETTGSVVAFFLIHK